MKLLYTLFFFVLLLFSSCNIINPAEPVPSYIHIDGIQLKITDAATQGTASSKITDAWVYIDDQLMGCFEMPVTFPVLLEGVHQLRIRAGIKVNGISATRSPYPFFDDNISLVNLKRGETTNLASSIKVKYSANVNFELLEDFESVGLKLRKKIEHSDTTLQILTAPDANVFEGNHSGAAYLDANRITFECVTVDSFLLPRGSAPVFLEFNYKSNYNFVVGVYAQNSATTQQFAALGYNPSDEWKKTYLYLTPNISGANTASNFRIYIGMLNSTGDTGIHLYLDNIKLVHF